MGSNLNNLLPYLSRPISLIIIFSIVYVFSLPPFGVSVFYYLSFSIIFYNILTNNNFSKKNKLGFLAVEYSGHGKSSGKFTNGNISKWTKETTLLIKKIVKKNRIILVGSSMGAWIALNQFKFFK